MYNVVIISKINKYMLHPSGGLSLHLLLSEFQVAVKWCLDLDTSGR